MYTAHTRHTTVSHCVLFLSWHIFFSLFSLFIPVPFVDDVVYYTLYSCAVSMANVRQKSHTLQPFRMLYIHTSHIHTIIFCLQERFYLWKTIYEQNLSCNKSRHVFDIVIISLFSIYGAHHQYWLLFGKSLTFTTSVCFPFKFHLCFVVVVVVVTPLLTLIPLCAFSHLYLFSVLFQLTSSPFYTLTNNKWTQNVALSFDGSHVIQTHSMQIFPCLCSRSHLFKRSSSSSTTTTTQTHTHTRSLNAMGVLISIFDEYHDPLLYACSVTIWYGISSTKLPDSSTNK